MHFVLSPNGSDYLVSALQFENWMLKKQASGFARYRTTRGVCEKWPKM
jgi:hypothetical protein